MKFMIYSKPAGVAFECKYCGEDVYVAVEDLDHDVFEVPYQVKCPECGRDNPLTEYIYD